MFIPAAGAPPQRYSRYRSDFREYPLGTYTNAISDAVTDTLRVNSATQLIVQDNPDASGSTRQNQIKLVPPAGAGLPSSAVTWNDYQAAQLNFAIEFKMSGHMANNKTGFSLVNRDGSWGATSTNSYNVGISRVDTPPHQYLGFFYKYVSNVYSTIGSSFWLDDLAVNTVMRARFYVAGTPATLYFKLWQAADAEPGAWTNSQADSVNALPSGRASIIVSNATYWNTGATFLLNTMTVDGTLIT